MSILETAPQAYEQHYSVDDSSALFFPDGHPGFGRVVDGLIRSDGSILVADLLSSSILHFGADRSYIEEWGRRGQGPGEFGIITGLSRMPADSVAIGEIGGRRISLLGPDGDFVRFARVTLNPIAMDKHRPVSSCCDFAGILATGDVLLVQPELVPTSGSAIVEGRVPVLVAPSTGALAVAVSEAKGGTHFFLASDGQPGVSAPLQLNTRVRAAPHRSGFVLVDGKSYAVRFFDSSGELLRISRVRLPRRPIDGEVRDAVQAIWHERLAEQGEEASRASGLWGVANAPFGDSLPAYTTVQSTLRGEVWAGSEQRSALNLPASYHVFDDAGRLVHSAALPARSRLLDASSSHLLVVSRDYLDVDRVFLIRR